MKQRTKRRLIAFLMVFALVVTTVLTDVPFFSSAEETGVVTLDNVSILINGKEESEITTIKDGDNLSISFEWELADDDTNTTKFKVNLDALSSNVKISAMDKTALKSQGVQVGYAEVIYEGDPATGYLYVTITDNTFLAKDKRRGGGTIEGVVSADGVNDGDPCKLGFADYTTKEFIYSDGTTPSSLNMQKSAGDFKYNSSTGQWEQTYKISLWPQNGIIEDIDIIDTMTGLQDIPGAKIEVVTAYDPDTTNYPIGTLFDSFEAFKTATGTNGIRNGFELEYTVAVDTGVFDSSAVYDNYNNKAKVTYTNSKGETVTTGESSAGVSVVRPTVSKTGVVDPTNTTATWTITIDLKDYAKKYVPIAGKKLSDIIQSVIDTPGTGLNASEKDILGEVSWINNGDGTFTGTYDTLIADAYKGSVKALDVKNGVTVTTKDNTTFSAEGTAKTNPVEWSFGKQFVSDNDGQLTWKVTVDKFPTGITNAVLTDDTNNWYSAEYGKGKHTLNGTITMEIDGGSPITVIENGVYTTAADEYIDTSAEVNVSNIKFKDSAFASGTGSLAEKTVVFTYTSTITDASKSGMEYKNKANLSFNSGGFTDGKEAEAVYQVKVTSPAILKDGIAVASEEAIEWKAKIDLKSIVDRVGTLTVGKDIVVKDTLPDKMSLVDVGSVRAKFAASTLYSNWELQDYHFGGTYAGVTAHPSVVVNETTGSVTFTINVTPEILAFITAAEDKGENPWVYVVYKTEIKDEADRKAFAENGATLFTNTAKVAYDGVVQGDPVSAQVELTPQDVVSKTGAYEEITKIVDGISSKDFACTYVVDVNPSAFDLVDGDTIIGKDTLGSALAYDLSSIKVYSVSGGVETELTVGANYSFRYNYAENSLTFTLPDATALRIKYHANVTIAPGEYLTPSNSSNIFELSGYTSDATEDEYSFSQIVADSKFWADADTGSISIYKYWTPAGSGMTALPGATFKLYKITYDAETDTFTESALLDSNGDPIEVTITDPSATTTIMDLPLNELLCIKETNAPNGYLTAEPYYFILDGSVEVPVPDGVTVNTYAQGIQMPIENFKAGKIVITKTIEGVVNEQEKAGGLVFTVTDSYGEVVGTYTLSDFDYDSVNDKYTKELEVPLGVYYVQETIYDIEGYECISVEYSVDEGTPQDGKTSSAEVTLTEADSDSTVAFTDEYNSLTETEDKELYLYKVDEAATALVGAVFKLYADGVDTGVTVTSTSAAGILVSEPASGWQQGVIYKLVESTPPAQCEPLSGAIEFEFEADGTVTLLSSISGVAVEGHGTSTKQNQIKVTNNYKYISVEGIKIWDDNNNQDGKRPASVTVELWAKNNTTNGWSAVSGKRVVITEAIPSWTYTFDNLREYDDNGIKIEYKVVELNVPDGYTVSGGLEANNYNLRNTYTTEKTDISIEKKWIDDNNQDGIRPSSIRVQLYANGVAEGAEQMLTAANGWKLELYGLDKYRNGALITYTLKETAIEGYTTVVSNADLSTDGVQKFVITNTHVSEATSVKVTKNWVHTGNLSTYPTSVTVKLLADGTEIESEVLNAGNGWTYTWDNLPKYSSGTAIVYDVVETSVENYIPSYVQNGNNFTITNTFNNQYTSMTVKKVWDDADDQDSKRPTSLTVKLMQSINGGAATQYGEDKILNVGNNWTYTWNDLPATNCTYTVEETLIGTDYVQASKVEAGTSTIITNKHVPATTYLNVKKVWVNDGKTQDDHAAIVVELYVNGNPTGKTLTLSKNNQWSGKFSNLPMYKKEDVQPLQYSIVERDVPVGYNASYSPITGDRLITVTNTYPATQRSVKKVWNDGNNQDGIRPAKITVQLMADGQAHGNPVELSVLNNWEYTWTGLPMKKNGNNIGYWVSELDCPTEYTYAVGETMQEWDSENAGIKYAQFVVTNNHTVQMTEVSVDKVWKDNDDAYLQRPSSITVQLYANGVPVSGASVTLNEGNSWQHTFTGIPKNSNGQPIVYTVREIAITDYVGTYTPITDGKITITNSYTKGKVGHSVIKIWDDNGNQDGIRPTSIDVQLYADDLPVGEPVSLSDVNNWTYQWTDLVQIKDGKEVVYTVKETLLPTGYSATTVNDKTTRTTTITNTHEPLVKGFSVKKVWNDNNNAAGLRTHEISVQLYANGVAQGAPVSLSNINDWAYSWNNLPAKSAGTDIVYTVQEVNTPSGYTSLQSTSGASITTITNKLVTETDEPDEPTTAEETTAEETTEEESEEETTEEESEDETTEEEDSDMDGDSEDDGDVETDDDGPAPNTGDKAMPFAMALLMVLSVLGIVALTVFGRKKKM